jgi:hypothetical protein
LLQARKNINCYNNQLLIFHSCNIGVQDIVQYGLMKPEQEHGYSVEDLEAMKVDNDPRVGTVIEKDGLRYLFNPDPTGRRTGECKESLYLNLYPSESISSCIAPVTEISDTINQTLGVAQKLISKV